MTTQRGDDDVLLMALTRRQVLRRTGVGAAALSLPGLLAACGSSKTSTTAGTSSGAAAASAEPIDRVTWYGLHQMTSLNAPAKDYNGFDAAVLATEPILTYGADDSVVGHLAESWRAVDAVTYVYKVRQGVKYWDGSPLTAEDIAYAMQRHVDPKVASLLAGLIPKTESIEVTSPTEVTVKLKKADATWATMPTYMLVAPKAFYEKLGNDYGAPRANSIMGTGPYKVTKFKPQESVTYVPNEDYWGDKPLIRNLVIQTIKDAQAALLAAQADQIDGTFDIPTDALADWQKLPNFKITSIPGPSLAFSSLDVTQEPFDDVHVRRAFAYSLDRPGLIKALLHGEATPAKSIVAPALWGGSVPQERVDEIYASLPTYDYDLDKAKQELAQSKYPNGTKATMWFWADNDAYQKIFVTWAESLKQIGIDAKVQPVDFNDAADREDAHHDLGMHPNQWPADYPDPVDLPAVLLPSWAAKKGSYNLANYKNPTVDKLIQENLQSVDPKQRADLLAQVMKIAAEEVPYIPMWTVNSTVAISKKFVYEDFSSLYSHQVWAAHIRNA